MGNHIRNTIELSIEASKRSGVPVLFLSNPGLGKTTDIENYARKNDMKVVTLIGAQRVREEVLGYMINSNGKAETLKPDWFNDLHRYASEGKKTILFVDELSTAPEDVQGALLQLIFGRKIGGEDNFLPEDTLIIAAANYKDNLPGQFNIMAPTLNRFMLVNLEPNTMDDLIDEFLGTNTSKDFAYDFSKNDITEDQKKKVKNDLSQLLKSIFSQYTLKGDDNNEYITPKNKALDGIYESQGFVFNFISGRSISYLERLTCAFVSMGNSVIDIKKSQVKDDIMNMVFGLIGAGSGNFEKLGLNYRRELHKEYLKLLDSIINNKNLDDTFEPLDYSKLSVGQAINEYQLHYSNVDKYSAKYADFIALHTKICTAYPINSDSVIDQIKSLESGDRKLIDFVGDMSKLDSFILYLEEMVDPGLDTFLETYKKIQSLYESYKLDALKSN